MLKLPKIVAVSIGFCWMSVSLLAVEEMYDIGVGHENSASWHFTNQLTTAWKTAYKAEHTRFVPRYTDSVDHRFELLRTRRIRFAIGPLKMLNTEMSKTSYIKVVSVLWEVFLAAVVSFEPQEEITVDTYTRWYIPEDSVIIPMAFPHNRTSYRKLSTESPWSEFMEEEHSEENGFVQSISSKELAAEYQDTQNDDPVPEFPAPATPEIVSVNREMLVKSPSLFYSDVLFYETIGSIEGLLSVFGNHLTIQSLHPQLIELLQKRIHWLSSTTYRPGNGENIRTVGMKMALFTHNAEDPDLVMQIIKLLNRNPYRFFPKSDLFNAIHSPSTRLVPRNLLHDAAILYYGAN